MNTFLIYNITGWLLAGIGLSLILIGLFAKRIVIHKLPHCGGCGYPLNGVPETKGAVICPECGRVPKNPAETYTMRRGKLFVIMGVILTAGSFVLPQIPAMRANGWQTAFPMSIQIRMWNSGDKRLRDRIYNKFRSGELQNSERDQLRTVVIKTLNDPNATGPELNSAVSFLYLTAGTPPLIEELDLAQAIINGSLESKKLYMQYVNSYPPPTSTELRNARRDATKDQDKFVRARAAGWLIRSPADDPEDLKAIRQLIIESDDSTFWYVRGEFDETTQEIVEIAVSLLDHEQTQIRKRALDCIGQYTSRGKYELSQQGSERVLALLDDPNTSISWAATLMTEDLPESAQPMIEELLLSTQDSKLFETLIHQIQRIDPDPVGLTPALAAISRNEGHSLRTRLKAVRAYQYIRSRAQVTDDPENLWPVYEALVKTLAQGDHETTLLYGSTMGTNFQPWVATAIGKLMLNEGVEEGNIGAWLTMHPGITALLRSWEHDTQNPIEQYHRALIRASTKGANSVEMIRAAAIQIKTIHFPNDPNPQPDP